MLAFVDLETTGLDSVHDTILEVGLVITDDDLKEVASTTTIVCADRQWLGEIKPEVVGMHTTNGLWEACAKSRLLLADAERACVDCLERAGQAPRTIPLAGSTISFDRGFLRHQMPIFESLLDYHNVDVSSFKEACARWRPASLKELPPQRKIHRVIPDIEDSIALLRYYRTHLFA